MPEPDEEEVPEPSEQSLIRKARLKMEDSKLLEAIIRYGMIAMLGAGSAMATNKVEDAGHDTIVQENRNGVLELREEVRLVREGFAQRVEVEEKEREDALKRLEHRLTRIETLIEVRLGVAPMPAAEAAAPQN